MDWHLDKNRPLCPQIEEQLCVSIATGEIKPSDRLPSVRELAVSASVNPNTVQKALESLEQKGLLSSVRGSGWFVSPQPQKAKEIVNQLIHARTGTYLEAMRLYGCDREEIIRIVKEWTP